MNISLTLKIGLAAMVLFMTGCSGPKQKEWKPEKERRAHAVAYRQLAPEPVYNRLRWVHAPDNLPARSVDPSSDSDSAAPVIFPITHLDLKSATLEEAGRALASSARYTSFCSSSISGRRVTLSKLGTIDELAAALAQTADVRVQIDHEGKAVRILPKPLPQPAFFGPDGKSTSEPVVEQTVTSDKVIEHEHKSPN